MHRTLLALLLTIPTATATAQSLLTVGPGPGRFPTIADALASAVPGDRVEVLAGDYAGFTLRQGVSVVGRTGARVVAGLLQPQTVRIENVPAGQQASISGLELDGSVGIELRSNQGRVSLERLRQSGGRTLTIVDTPGATIDHCQFATNASITRSADIAIRDSSFVPTAFAFALDGLTVALSSVELIATEVAGGSLQIGGQSGIRIQDASVRLRGNGNVVRLQPSVAPRPAPAIVATGVSSLEVDPDTRLEPALGSPPIVGVTPTSRERPALHASAASLPGIVAVTLRDATPAATAVVFVSVPGAPLTVPGLDTPLWLDLPMSILVRTETVPGNGVVGLQVPVAADDLLVGRAFVWQALVLSPAGAAELTNGAGYVHGR